MSAFGIAVTEDHLDLIQFLNDGVRPSVEKKPTFFIFEIVGPREITGKIVFADELQSTPVHELLFS
jgi:hypothetical protein